MSQHLTEADVYEIAVGSEPSPTVEAHLASCHACRREVAATRRLLAAVEDLDPRVEAPADLERILLERLGGERRAWAGARGWMWRAAAAILLFAAGAVAHAAWDAGRRPGFEAPAGSSPTLAVQRAGTEYVASIARLVADSGRLSPEDLRAGREVALAAMSGAAFELWLLSEKDAATTAIHRLVVEAWTEGSGP